MMEEPTTNVAFINKSTLLLLLIISGVCYFAFRHKGQEIEHQDGEDSDSMAKRVKEIADTKQREIDRIRDIKKDFNPNDPTEFSFSMRRYKLYHYPRLPYKEAKKFCKKMDGIMAGMKGLDNHVHQRLEMLMSNTGSEGFWIGVEKKKKKKKKPPPEEEDYPNGGGMMGYPGAGMGMGGMGMGDYEGMDEGIMGGRGQCPTYTGTPSPYRPMRPTECMQELPFVCEFDRFAKPRPLPHEDEIQAMRSRKKGKFKSLRSKLPKNIKEEM